MVMTVANANGPLPTIDYTKTAEYLFGHLLAPDCQIILDERQFEVLKRYLEHIDGLGDGVNFRLGRCIDYRDFPQSAGHMVDWDNDGTGLQDDLIDTIMEDLVQHLGFTGGSILREGHLINLDDIDARVADIL
jgi:hypothetical protein